MVNKPTSEESLRADLPSYKQVMDDENKSGNKIEVEAKHSRSKNDKTDDFKPHSSNNFLIYEQISKMMPKKKL